MTAVDATLSYQSILGSYAGQKPEAPAWFHWALAQPVTRSFFESDAIQIELLTWGQIGQPGLLFLHGDSAHADWWSFIAPFFAPQWRCAAMSWSGMGRSGWRKNGYQFTDYADEIAAAINAAKLDNGTGVIIIAHSLGGYPSLLAGAHLDQLRGIITVDSAILPQELQTRAPKPAPRSHRVYTTDAEALARFRFLPPGIGDQHYLIDHVARHGMRQTVDANGNQGWSWCFDPEIWRGNEQRIGNLAALPKAVRCPLVVMIGEQSQLIVPKAVPFMRSIYPEGTPFIFIPAAGHHVMIDQPLALIAALRTCLEFWPEQSKCR